MATRAQALLLVTSACCMTVIGQRMYIKILITALIGLSVANDERRDVNSLLAMVFHGVPQVNETNDKQTTTSSNKEWEQLIDLIFSQNTTGLAPLPPTTKSPSAESTKSCTINGEDGECVKYYLCDSKDIIPFTDPERIDSHVPDDECESYLEVCCRPLN